MKILHVPNAYFPVSGGAEHLCRRVSEGMARLGHQVRVLTADVGSGEAYYRYGVARVRAPRQEVLNGVEIHRIAYGRILYPVAGWFDRLPGGAFLAKRLTTLSSRTFARSIEAEIRAYSPDVVMTLPHMVTNVQCVFRAHEKKTFPLVFLPLLHEEHVQAPSKELRDSLFRADAVIAVTDYEAEVLVRVCGIPSEKVFTGWLGADLPASQAFEKKKSVLFLGRISEEKGVSALLEAMETVWQKEADAELVVAGPRTSTSPSIEGEIASLQNQGRRIRYAGQVSEEEKSRLLSAASCLVLPSKGESFGMVFLEAWANSVPVVAWDFPVFHSFIESGKDGLLVSPGDTKELGRAILRILDDRPAAMAMGSAGRRKVEARFQWDVVVSRYLEAYEYAIRHAHIR